MNNKNTLSAAIEASLDKFFKMHDGDCPESGLYERVVSEVERVLIQKTLEQVGGVQIKASKFWGLIGTLYAKRLKI